MALEILQFCAFLHPDEIPEEIFTDYRPIPDVDHDLQPLCADQFEFNSCVKSLLRFSLIQRNADTKTLTIHRLVQAVIKDTMNQSSQKVWAERTVKYISGSFPFAEPKTWQICQRYLSHAYICMELVKQWNLDFMEAAGLLYRTGKYLFQRAIYGEAEIYYLKSFEISENKYGSEYPGLASILENLAQLYDRQGRFSLAEEYYQQALELNKKVFSSESLNVAANLNDLAGLYRDQGNYIKAESYYHKALRLRKKQGLKSPKILNDLALLYKAQGKHTKAEPYYKETITSKSSEENINLASSLSNLADLYRDQRRFAEAEPLSLRALKISEEIQGPEHPDVATKANNLAVIYLEQNRLEEAEVLLLRVIAINKKAFESEHPATATALNNLAQIYLRQKKYPEAQKALKQAISIYEMLVGPVHPNIATSFGNLALCYALQQKNEEAEALYKHTLTTWELTSGKEPLKIIYTLRNYAFLLRDTKRKFEAVSLDNQAKEMEANMMKDNRENIKKQRNSSENTKAKPKRRKSIK